MHPVARFKLFFILQPALSLTGSILTCKYLPIGFTRLSSSLKAGQTSRFCWNKNKLLSSEQDPVPAEWRELQGTHAQRGDLPSSFFCLWSILEFQLSRYLFIPADKSFLTIEPE